MIAIADRRYPFSGIVLAILTALTRLFCSVSGTRWRPRPAAEALGISPRSLWTLTNKGDIPVVRFGRTVLYPVDLLREMLLARAGGRRQNMKGGRP